MAGCVDGSVDGDGGGYGPFSTIGKGGGNGITIMYSCNI